MTIADIVDLKRYPLDSPEFGASANAALDEHGVLVLEGFIRPEALKAMQSGEFRPPNYEAMDYAALQALTRPGDA